MQDLAILTNTDLISEELGLKLEKVKFGDLGNAKKIVISKDDTTLVSGQNDNLKVSQRCEQIKQQIEESNSEYDVEKLQERLAKLSGGVAVLKVGGITEVEIKEKKDRVEDAYYATKAAIAEGIVPGGGCTFLYVSKQLDDLKKSTINEERVGVEIVQKSLQAPARKILSNAGLDSGLIVSKLLEHNKSDQVYDVLSEKYVNSFDKGIVDPTKVLRSAITSSVSIASLLVTTEATVTEKPSENNVGNNSSGMGGGMPGMGM
jgi:chaperonin GroEL